MAKILVLCTFDTHREGHGWTAAKKLEKEGNEVCLITLHRNESYETNFFFFDGLSKCRYLNIFRYLYSHFDAFVLGKLMRPDPLYCFQTTGLYGIPAKLILNKCPFKPQIIYIMWTARFLTPKTIRDIYNLTGAKIVFIMVDQSILAACHYPANCTGYKNGCKNCPGVKHLKCLPRRLVAMKEKFWGGMPADIHGTSYDIKLANEIPFLNHMVKVAKVSVPDVKPVIPQNEARRYFGISDDEFVIFAGASGILEKRKGFDVLMKAINLFSEKINLSRHVTLLLLGRLDDGFPYDVDNKICLIIRPYLPFEDLLKAYYACNVHASPSLADSGPMMVNFSIACGRPVVAFPIGVAVDLVVSGKTGYLAEYGSVEDFASGLEYFYSMDKNELSHYEIRCRSQINKYL